MPTFDFTGPDGKSYSVEGPEGATAEQAFGILQSQLGGANSVSPPVSDGPPVAGDVAKSAGVGVGKGIIGLYGMPADVRSLASRALEYGFEKIGYQHGADAVRSMRELFGEGKTSQAIQKQIEDKFTGEFYKPQTTAGEYARTVGEFVPAAALPFGGGPWMRAASAVTGGLGSEAAGQLTKGTAAEPYARVVGGVVGGFAPSLMGKVITPIPSSPERERLFQVLRNEGVDAITAGQRTGSNSLRYMESALGDAPLAGGKAQDATRRAQEQFTSAALSRAGARGPLATPDVMQANQTRLGDIFNDISSRNVLVPDQRFVSDILSTAQKYVADVLPSQRVQGKQNIETILRDIVENIQSNGGAMPGEMYQATRSRLSKMADGVRQSDPQLSDALRKIRNTLDDGFARSIPADDAALLAKTRKEYGAQKVLEKSASRAGEATGEGIIVPANLRNTVSAENRGAYARGQGDLTELSRAGATVMTPMPQSGTGPRMMANGIPALFGSLLGGGAGAATSGGLGAGLGAAAGATLGPGIAGRVLMSRPVQSYLGNQLLPGQAPSREAFIRSLLQSTSNQRLQHQSD